MVKYIYKKEMEKKNMRIKREVFLLSFFTLFFLFFLIGVLGFVFSAETIGEGSLGQENLTLESKSIICLSESGDYMGDLSNKGFNVFRVNETLGQAQTVFDAKLERKATKDSDFQAIIDYCDLIEEIYGLAFISRDEINTLNRFYEESITESMNSTGVDILIEEINEEMENERYEKIQDLISETYDEIIHLQSENTALETVKRNTRNFLIRFFTKNWQIKLGVLIFLILLFFLIKKPILIRYFSHKAKKLEVRRLTLKKLIRKTQAQYFESKSLDEGTYNIRTTKFAELIRDIDRQVPLIKEEIAKLRKGRKYLYKDSKENKPKNSKKK